MAESHHPVASHHSPAESSSAPPAKQRSNGCPTQKSGQQNSTRCCETKCIRARVEHALYGWQEIEIEIPIEYTREEEMAAFSEPEHHRIEVLKTGSIETASWVPGTSYLVGGMALINMVWLALIIFLSLR
eukprot:451331-Hanusia_phi.AAC.1